MIALRESPSEAVQHTVVVEADIGKGFAVRRKIPAR